MSNQLTSFSLLLLDMVEPLQKRLQTPDALEYLFYRYGWSVTLDDAAFAHIQQGLAVIVPLEAFISTAESMRAKLDANPDTGLSESDASALAQAALTLVRVLAEFKMPDLSGFADPLAQPEFWESIAENVLDDLLEEYLRVYQPGFYLLFRVWGIIQYETISAEASRNSYTRTIFDWGQAGAAVKDPLEALKQAYNWGSTTHAFDYAAIIDSLNSVLRALGASSASVVPALATQAPVPSDAKKSIANGVSALRVVFLQGNSVANHTFYRIGFEVFPAVRTGETQPTGLIIKPVLEGGAGVTLPVGKALSLTWNIAASLDEVIGFALFPSEADLIGGAPSIGTSLTLATSGKGPWYLLGNSHTSRIEISNFSVGISLSGTINDPEIKLQVACAGSSGQPGCRIVASLDDSDEFVKSATQQSALDFSFSPELAWSSKTGFSFSGSPTLDFVLPLKINLGPVSLTNATITFDSEKTTSTSGLTCQVGVGISGKIGPIGFAISGIGFSCTLVPYTSSNLRALPQGAKAPVLGALDIDIGFMPPSGAGLTLDSAGVSGGGFLKHDDSKQEYSGVLQLKFNDLALQAFGLITTQVAGGDGYSLLALIDADFPPIQLGWGFTLNGVGGLLAVHRTASVDALRAGVKSGKISSILFPKSPITNASQILGTLDTLFPTAPGRFLFGPMALIGWGTPTVLTASIAVILELPEPIEIILLAKLTVQLPNPSAALVTLNMDALGVLDLTQDDLSLDASLFDSKLISYPITGDMALRANWSSQREFLLAIGGFHPQFTPPSDFPSLNRVTINMPSGIVSKLRLAAYLAITSNSVQFGSTLDVFIGVSGCGISGHLGFDALLQLDPFHFSADISGSVAITFSGDDLASVSLDASLSGPAPWNIAGKFKIHIIFFDVNKSFSESWGLSAPSQQTSTVDVGALLNTALADPRNWSSQLPAGLSALVSTRKIDDNSSFFAHPLALLEVHEQIVPLGLTITHFGEAVPSGATEFSITDFRVGTQSTTHTVVQDDFAPAQFFDLSDNDKLSRPSFERHDAGAIMSGNLVANGTSFAKTIDYESFFINTPGVVTVDEGVPQPFPWGVLPIVMRTGSAARKTISQAGKLRYAAPGKAITVGEPVFALASTSTLAAVPTPTAAGTTYSDAAAALKSAVATSPTLRNSLQIVASHELIKVGA